MRLIQIKKGRSGRQVVATDGGKAWVIPGYATIYDLAMAAIAKDTTIEALVAKAGQGARANPAKLLADGRVLAPIAHPDPARGDEQGGS